MKRNWDCVRAILHELEEQPLPSCALQARAIEGWDEQVVAEHMRLLAEHGLIEAAVKQLGDGRLFAVAHRLTWDGHELLGKLDSKPLWNAVRKVASERGLELTLEMIVLLAAKIAKDLTA